MPKKAVSLTLDEDNLLWLQSQAAAAKRRSLSDTVDRIVTAARKSGRVLDSSIRSVVHSVDINPDDPDLAEADAHVAALFAASIQRPWLVREQPPKNRASAKPPRKSGG
jgi:hypothetical protein